MTLTELVTFALLLLLYLPQRGDSAPDYIPKFIFCPGFRDTNDGGLKQPKSDPLWLLEKYDEWIPFRSHRGEQTKKFGNERRMKFFGCFLYHITTFGHYILDFFFPPFYGFPYYRVAVEYDPKTGYTVMRDPYDSPQVIGPA